MVTAAQPWRLAGEKLRIPAPRIRPVPWTPNLNDIKLLVGLFVISNLILSEEEKPGCWNQTVLESNLVSGSYSATWASYITSLSPGFSVWIGGLMPTSESYRE